MAHDYSLGNRGATDPAPADASSLADDFFEPPRTTLRPTPRSSRSPWALPQEGDILLHKYRVEQVRGQSGLETVLFATHLELGQKVILRVLSPQASEQPELVQRFARSARKAMEVRNEHAERVMDFGRLDSGCPYRVAELPRGPSLAEILQVRGPLPVEEATDILLAVAEAVAATYAARLSHCTLSAASVFVERRVDGTPWARIVDLGAFDHFGAEHLGGHELSIPGAHGALPYTAPEQLRNPGAVDARADIWALGALQYELLSGRPPFEAEGSIALLAMIAADTPAPLRTWVDVPLELENCVEACLRKDPAARPQNISELAALLSPFTSTQGREIAARVSRSAARSLRPSGLPAVSEPPRSLHPPSLGWQGVSVPPPSVAPKAQTWGGMAMAVGISIVAAVVTTLLILNDQPEQAAAHGRQPLASDNALHGAAVVGVPVGSVQLLSAAAAHGQGATAARAPTRERSLPAQALPAQPLAAQPLTAQPPPAQPAGVQTPAAELQPRAAEPSVPRTNVKPAAGVQNAGVENAGVANESAKQALATGVQSPASARDLFNDVE